VTHVGSPVRGRAIEIKVRLGDEVNGFLAEESSFS